MSRVLLLQGNQAVVEGAIAAGVRFYGGYPITPSTEIAEGMAKRLPQVGGKFMQTEDELAGIGTVLTVLALLLCSAWNHTAYYPSTADLQSSLTMANSCSSEFTLRTMFYVSLLVPFVLGYIIYAWRAIDSKKITAEEIKTDEAY